NQDKATKPQTVQIVRQGEATLYWFKFNPLYEPTTSAKSSRQAPASCTNRRKCRLKAEYRFRRHSDCWVFNQSFV
ncbi:hypothetical protein DV046_12130, partial [Neisseria gonorrhoeae]